MREFPKRLEIKHVVKVLKLQENMAIMAQLMSSEKRITFKKVSIFLIKLLICFILMLYISSLLYYFLLFDYSLLFLVVFLHAFMYSLSRFANVKKNTTPISYTTLYACS